MRRPRLPLGRMFTLMEKLRPAFFLCCVSLTCCFAGNLTVSPLFSDHGILQQDAIVPVWGTAKPGASLSVNFRGARSEAVADSSGKWIVRIQTPKAEPGKDDGYDLTVSSDSFVKWRAKQSLAPKTINEYWPPSARSSIG